MRRTRRLLAGLLAVAGLSYGVVVCVAYLQVTSANSLWPEIGKLDGVFFGPAKTVSTIERLLESSEGPMNRAGTMRPAFTEESVGWEPLIQSINWDEKLRLEAEREGERLALLAWVRSGLSRADYEADDFRWDDEDATDSITAIYVAIGEISEGERGKRVRIRSLVSDRCVTCHGDDGRHELARWIPLDTYENIERHCRPESNAAPGGRWLVAALVGLAPLGIFSGAVFLMTPTAPARRRAWALFPCLSLSIVAACWAFGRPHTIAIYGLVLAAGCAGIGVLIQIIVSVAELLDQNERA